MDIILVKSPNFDDIIAQESQGAAGPAGNDVAADELEGGQLLSLHARPIQTCRKPLSGLSAMSNVLYSHNRGCKAIFITPHFE